MGQIFRRSVVRAGKFARSYVEKRAIRHRLPSFEDWPAYREVNELIAMVSRSNPALPRMYSWHPYGWGLAQAGRLARALKVDRFSAIEFGSAGGNGLCVLETAQREVEAAFGVTIDLFGFDSGTGLPEVTDVRDLPNLFASGDYWMDLDALRARLQRAELLIGWLEDTVPEFLRSNRPPVGFVAFDLDLYSSTTTALRLLQAEVDRLLPRVHCYFDDVIGFTYAQCNGELLAIREFNDAHLQRQVCPIPGLRYFLPQHMRTQAWPDQIYLAHILDHPRYGDDDGLNPSRQAPLL